MSIYDMSDYIARVAFQAFVEAGIQDVRIVEVSSINHHKPVYMLQILPRNVMAWKTLGKESNRREPFESKTVETLVKLLKKWGVSQCRLEWT